MTIPAEIDGNPVKYYALVDPPQFPRGYPGDGGLEETVAFLISVSDEDNEEDKRFQVRCLGVGGTVMAGDMCYTLEHAMAFPQSEFDVSPRSWVARNS